MTLRGSGRIAFSQCSFHLILCRRGAGVKCLLGFFRVVCAAGSAWPVFPAGWPTGAGLLAQNRQAVASPAHTPPAGRKRRRFTRHPGWVIRQGRFRNQAWDPHRRMVRGSTAHQHRAVASGRWPAAGCRSTGAGAEGFFPPRRAGQSPQSPASDAGTGDRSADQCARLAG